MLGQDQERRWLSAACFVAGFLCLADPWPADNALPLREAAVVGLLALACLPRLYRQGLRGWRGPGIIALLAVVLVALSGRRANSDVRALVETVQFACYMLLMPALLQAESIDVISLAKGCCTGALALLCGPWLGALLAGSWGAGTSVDNRLIYGVGLAAVLPFAVLFLQAVTPLWRRFLLGVGGALAAAATVTSLPAAVLGGLSLADATRRDCRPRAAGVSITVAWVAAAGITLLLLNPDAAYRSFSPRDAQGRLRRWVQEDIAACRAILDAPLGGHGLGRYQETVSAGQYRRELPRPGETKVEPGMESGVLVIAVESGVPAALAVVGLFLAAGLPRRRVRADANPADPVLSAARRGALVLGAGLFLTVINDRGGGLLCGLLLGLAGRREDGDPARRRPQAITQAALALVAVGAMLLSRHLPAGWTSPHGAAGLLTGGAPGTFNVVLTADAAEEVAPVVERLAVPGTASQRVLNLPDLALVGAAPRHLAAWHFKTPRPARVVLWVRVWWEDGCGNSLAAGIDGMPPLLVGNDGTYKAWHWVRGYDLDLAAGDHVLVCDPREDGIRLDQILITSAVAAAPQGLLAPDGSALTPAPPGAASPTLPSTPLLPREAPFLVGVGGCYRGGFEAAVLALGLPWSKVNDADLARPARLARFNLICLSETREADADAMYRALQGYVEQGGILVHENCTGPVPAAYQTNLLFWPTPVPGQAYQGYGGALRTDGSAFFSGLAAGSLYTLRLDVPHMLQQGTPGPEWTGHGTLLVDGREDGAAIWERQLGKGRLIYSRVPLSFHTMWRGPELMPPLKSLLTALTRERCPAVAPIPLPQPPAGPQDSVSDDFMRAGPEPSPSWVLSGKGACTGEHGPEPHTEFSLLLEAGARASASQAFTQDWTVSAAVLPEHGSGGIWMTVGDAEVQLLVDRNAGLRLDRLVGGRRETRGQVPLPEGGGWHRLSLSLRGGICTAFVDGQTVLRCPDLPRTANPGRFGLLCEDGRLFADDVVGRPSSGVLTGTDRYLGDEGSSQAWGGLSQRGIEKSTVYSLQWLTQGSPLYANAVVLGLPAYAPGTLLADGAPLAAVAAHPDPAAAVALPDPTSARRSIGFASSGWRDYVFSGRQTDWFCTGADWIPLSRWSCDPNWYWLGAETSARTALWFRHRLEPPYAVSVLVSVGARNRFGEEYSRGRDMNLALGVAEGDVLSGVAVRVMNAADRGIEVWQDGERVHSIPDVGLPSGHSLHHNWFEITAIAEQGRVRLRFEGCDLGEIPLPKPLRPGRTAVWTENNSIRLARATLALAPTP